MKRRRWNSASRFVISMNGNQPDMFFFFFLNGAARNDCCCPPNALFRGGAFCRCDGWVHVCYGYAAGGIEVTDMHGPWERDYA